LSSDNPFVIGDEVSIKRGAGWLTGYVIKTILARVHIQIDSKVFVENWHDCKKERTDDRRINQSHSKSTTQRRLTRVR
jgi:uncharacterized protein (DUF2342 family)